MQTTLIGQKRNSNMQLMGETREPMALDCWEDANRLANSYKKKLGRDFWILFAGKPHVSIPNAVVMGWEVIAMRPSEGMVGVMVFHWSHKDQRLTVDNLSLPYDVPLSELELSTSAKDYTPSLHKAAKESGSILLA